MAKKTVTKGQAASAKSGIQPLSDRVLVRRDEMPDKKSAAGIVLPDSAQKEKSKLGTVIAVGPGRTTDEGVHIPTTVAVGAKVIFNSGWDNEVSVDDDHEYFLVRESDILAVIK